MNTNYLSKKFLVFSCLLIIGVSFIVASEEEGIRKSIKASEDDQGFLLLDDISREIVSYISGHMLKLLRGTSKQFKKYADAEWIKRGMHKLVESALWHIEQGSCDVTEDRIRKRYSILEEIEYITGNFPAETRREIFNFAINCYKLKRQKLLGER